MVIINHERVGKALDLLKAGLAPFLERDLKAWHGDDWALQVREMLADTRLGDGKGDALQDVVSCSSSWTGAGATSSAASWAKPNAVWSMS